MKPTEENIKVFLKEKADRLREKQTRKLAQEKRERTAKNFMNNELMFNLLTSSFRSQAWFSSPEYKAESHNSISSSHTSSSFDTNSSSISSSSGWSDFGGGGGFSGGDGSSGGW
ncbi:hypothetical protein ABVR74_06060 [Lactococcus lactis subsp. lactis]|uniref:hypothetical protein n=1 Tax=Lactococcus lactis TaxID=1358 RepID=UPI00338D6F74